MLSWGRLPFPLRTLFHFTHIHIRTCTHARIYIKTETYIKREGEIEEIDTLIVPHMRELVYFLRVFVEI